MWSTIVSLFTLGNAIATPVSTAGCNGDVVCQVLKNANPTVRPDEVDLTVKHAFKLVEVVSEENGDFTLLMYPEIRWTDSRLKWSDSNVDTMHVPVKDIWRPDLVTYNMLEKERDLIDDLLAVIYPNGEVFVVPFRSIKVRCKKELNKKFICPITVGSWTYSANKLNLELISRKVDVSFYKGSEFEVISSSAFRKSKKYPCCPEKYVSLQYEIIFRQK